MDANVVGLGLLLLSPTRLYYQESWLFLGNRRFRAPISAEEFQKFENSCISASQRHMPLSRLQNGGVSREFKEDEVYNKKYVVQP